MIIKIKVRAKSGKQLVEKISENEYKACVKSAPENNNANAELIKLLKTYFKKSGSKKQAIEDIRIIKGARSRDKTVLVS